jgi:hypothetical protein
MVRMMSPPIKSFAVNGLLYLASMGGGIWVAHLCGIKIDWDGVLILNLSFLAAKLTPWLLRRKSQALDCSMADARQK